MAVLNSVIAFLSSDLPAAITPDVAAPSGMWHKLILDTFAFVSDYGWRIVVFTVLLKLVLSPLDFYQRYKMHKNQKITERLKPTMEKIQKQYGNDKQAFAQKQMELNRKEGYSYFSACLPMIVTMVVFISLWMSMQTVAQYMTFKEYTSMYDEYKYVSAQIVSLKDSTNDTLTAEQKQEETLDDVSKRIGQDVVYQMYYYGLDESYTATLERNAEYKDYIAAVGNFRVMRDGVSKIGKVQASFLWIKNIWAPDVPWGDQAVLDKKAFETGIADYNKASTSKLDTGVHAVAMADYNDVMGKLLADKTQSRVNGYLLLPLLVVLLSVGSQLLATMQQKKAGQVTATGDMASSMKVMMVIMPIMMGYFSLQYASIFSLYMALSSAIVLVLNFLFSTIIKLIDNRKRTRAYGIVSGSTRYRGGGNSPIIHYVKGANPNAGAKQTPSDVESEKNRQSASRNIVRGGGRPDPNELMGIDMSDRRDKKK